MSVRRIVSSLAVIAPLLVIIAVAGWHAFPLAAAPAEPSDSPGVQVNEDGYFRLLHRPGVEYPAEARRKGISGYVVARVTVDESGAVTDASIVSGPQPLRAAVLTSVLKWHFDPNQRIPEDRSFEIGVRFTASAAEHQDEAGLVDPQMLTPPITGVDVSRLPAALQEKAAVVLRRYVGQRLSGQQVLEVHEALTAVDQHLKFGMYADDQHAVLRPELDNESEGRVRGGVSGGIPGGIVGGVAGLGPSGAPGPLTINADVQQMNLVSKRMPVYPPEAKQARIQGTVRLKAVIGRDGHVKGLTLVSGHPLLVTAAADAVKDWVYRPTLLNGEPVEVATDIYVNFALSQ